MAREHAPAGVASMSACDGGCGRTVEGRFHYCPVCVALREIEQNHQYRRRRARQQHGTRCRCGADLFGEAKFCPSCRTIRRQEAWREHHPASAPKPTPPPRAAFLCEHGRSCPYRCRKCGLHVSDALPDIYWLGESLSTRHLCAVCEKEQTDGHALVCAPRTAGEQITAESSVIYVPERTWHPPSQARQIYSWGHNGQRGATA